METVLKKLETKTMMKDVPLLTVLNLQEIEFPPSLKYLGQSAFYGCKNLRRVRFNYGLKIIDEDAFNYCTNLKEVTLPYLLQKIGLHNFRAPKKSI